MACFLVDFENVNSSGLAGITELSEDDSVYIFYTVKANSLTFAAHMDIMKSKAKVEYFPVTSGGRNALDFQLATYLGYFISRGAEMEYYIISNDMGFDFVKNFWNGREESGNAGIRRTNNISKAMADIRSRNMENELVHDELVHEAYVLSEAAGDVVKSETGDAPDSENGKSFDFIAAADEAMTYEVPEVPERPQAAPNIPPVPQLFGSRNPSEKSEEDVPEAKSETVVPAADVTVENADKPAAAEPEKIVIDYGEFTEVLTPKKKRGRPEKKKSEPKPAAEPKTEPAAEDTVVQPAEGVITDQLVLRIMDLAAGVVSVDEAERVADTLRKSDGKQAFYRSLMSMYGMEHGGNIYRKIKSEYTNMRKLISDAE